MICPELLRGQTYLLLKVKPGRGVQEMAIAVERFIDAVILGKSPRAFQVAQHRFEIFTVITDAVVLVPPRPEPLPHLRDLLLNGAHPCHFRWDFRVGNVLRGPIVLGGRARLDQFVVVVTGSKLHSIEDGDEFPHAHHPDVVGVLVDGGEAAVHVGRSVVRFGSLRPQPTLFDTGSAVRPDALLHEELLQHHLAGELSHYFTQAIYLHLAAAGVVIGRSW